MAELTDEDYQAYEEDLKILVDALRKSFNAEKARYQVVGHQNTLFIEIEGLEDISEEVIQEVAEPIFNELDMDFDEIFLVPLNKK